MKIHKLVKINLDTEETIMTASLSNADECIMLMSSGNVIRYKIVEQSQHDLFSIKSVFVHEDGGFDITAPSTIYTLYFLSGKKVQCVDIEKSKHL